MSNGITYILKAREIFVGDILELTTGHGYKNPIWETEKRLKTFYILRGTKILVLEKNTETNLCKILILTGERTGRTGYENLLWLEENYYKKIESIKDE